MIEDVKNATLFIVRVRRVVGDCDVDCVTTETTYTYHSLDDALKFAEYRLGKHQVLSVDIFQLIKHGQNDETK